MPPNPLFEGLSLRDAVIASIINNQRWFGNDPPHWIVGKGQDWERPSQSAKHASTQRTQSAMDMYRHTQPDILQLARKIDSCRPDHRCESGACPECQRALQRWFVDTIHKATKPLLSSGNKLIFASLVPDYAATDPMRPNMNWEKVIGRLCSDLGKVGIPWAIGGSDFSVNVDKVDNGAPILQGQFYLLMEEPKGDWHADLNKLINSSDSIYTPVNSSRFYGSKAQLAYAIKNEFEQRNAIIKNSNPHRNPQRNTRYKKLKIAHRLPLMKFLDQIGLEGRLIDHNALNFSSNGLPQVHLGKCSKGCRSRSGWNLKVA